MSEAPASLITTRDYTSADAYVGDTPLHFWTGEGAERRTETIPLQPPQTDVRFNPNELPSALGRYFAQGDFSHGSLQPYFHYQSSDQAKFLHSEGFDVSEPGLLRHLHAVLQAAGGALDAGSAGRVAQAGGSLFVTDGTNVIRYDTITGSVTVENPHAGEGAVTVQDITAEGDRVFVALGVNGIHVRSAAGTWTHHGDTPGGVGYILCEWLKDRLIATSDRNLYEITAAGAAPAGKQPLQEGWTYTDLGENGPYIYATCNDGESLSKAFHFGLNDSLAVTVQGSSWLPEGELAYSIKGYLGIVLIGCGRVNMDSGKDALLYKAVPSANGFLPIELIAESEGAGALDLSVKALGTRGRKFLCGWSLGEDYPYGSREGMAIYDPALDSFVHHHAAETGAATPKTLLAVTTFEGRHIMVSLDGVFYEDMDNFVSQATLTSSIATFLNSGLKKWDESELATKPLPATSSVDVQYSVIHPDENVWSLAGSHETTDETTARFRHANVESSRLAIRIVSNASSSGALAPEIESFSVRVNPTVENVEYRLVRTIHLTAKHAKGHRGQLRYYNPRDERDALREQVNQFVDWHEADSSYNARLVQMTELQPATNYKQTGGDPLDEEFIVQLVMEGRTS